MPADPSIARSLRHFLRCCMMTCSAANEEKCMRNALEVWEALSNEAGRLTFDHDKVIAMIETGAYESAAIALLEPGSAFMLSRGVTGNCIATVVPPHCDEEFTFEAGSLATALVCAEGVARLASIGAPETRSRRL